MWLLTHILFLVILPRSSSVNTIQMDFEVRAYIFIALLDLVIPLLNPYIDKEVCLSFYVNLFICVSTCFFIYCLFVCVFRAHISRKTNPEPQTGIEHATSWWPVRHSNHWATESDAYGELRWRLNIYTACAADTIWHYYHIVSAA